MKTQTGSKITLTASFNRLSLDMTLAQALSASHQGQCDADVALLVTELDGQLNELDPDDIRAEVGETGAWDEEELADDAQNRHRLVWMAAGQIKDEWSALDPQVRALALHLECSPSDIEEETYDSYGMPVYHAEGGEYAVATDREADVAWDQSLDSYITECIDPELEKMQGLGNLSAYIKFDEEMLKRDAKMDGRGHSLSSYDGEENEQEVDGETYYIYRLN